MGQRVHIRQIGHFASLFVRDPNKSLRSMLRGQGDGGICQHTGQGVRPRRLALKSSLKPDVSP
jgi:hypothetical protein